MRHKLVAILLVGGFCALLNAAPAVAEDKGIIALQQSVSLLMNQVADLQKNFNQQIGMMQGLVTQNTDTVNKLASSIDGIQRTLNGNQVVAGQQQNNVAKEFQALNDTIATLEAHLQQMTRTLQQIQQMQQTIPAAPAATPAPGAGPDSGSPSAFNAAPVPASPAASSASALRAYQRALSDFQNGNSRAQKELTSFIHAYPNDPQIPDAIYYLGTIYLQKQQYNEAIDRFSALIEQYPDSAKTPPAELNKGIALARRGDKTAAISELRALSRNYPGTEAARQADIELRGLGATPSRRR